MQDNIYETEDKLSCNETNTSPESIRISLFYLFLARLVSVYFTSVNTSFFAEFL